MSNREEIINGALSQLNDLVEDFRDKVEDNTSTKSIVDAACVVMHKATFMEPNKHKYTDQQIREYNFIIDKFYTIKEKLNN